MRERPKIDKFGGEYSFLSNFYPHEFEYQGITWPTAEHAYQASKAKMENKAGVTRLILATKNPGSVKAFGKKIELREDWEDVKLHVMKEILRYKFSSDYMSEKLMSTNGFDLVEGNTWGDTYWGVCRGVGKNYLGKLIMTIRQDQLSARIVRLSKTNPAYWIQRIHIMSHVTDCREKREALDNCAVALEAILSRYYPHIKEEIEERIR